MKLETFKPMLLAMSIGDGHITKDGRLVVRHGEKQYEYLEWKFKLIKPLCVQGRLIPVHAVVKEKSFNHHELRTFQNWYLKSLRHEIYPEGIKRISREILDQLTSEGVSIWYMDDGGLGKRTRADGTKLASELFLNTLLPKENNQIIIDYFKEVWGVDFVQVHNKNGLYRLRCGAKELRKFLKIVEPTVMQVPSMRYKIDVGQHKNKGYAE